MRSIQISQCYLPSGGVFSPVPLNGNSNPAATPSHAFSISNVLHRMFIPRGSLPPDYLTFQSLDCLQGLCSYLRGSITMHATLTGLGYGSDSASALSVVSTSLLKEGTSHLSSLAFAFGYSSLLDGEVRFWRLVADVANDIGLTLELAAPLAGPSGFLPLTCLANAFKAVCGVAAGATRVTISSHFTQGVTGAHVAEVTAKEGTQETAVTLTGNLFALFLLPYINANPLIQWTSFILLTVIHVMANAAAVRCLALRTLSRTRALLLFEASSSTLATTLPSPLKMRSLEPLWPVQYRWWGLKEGGRLTMGCSMGALRACAERGQQALPHRSWLEDCEVYHPSCESTFSLAKILELGKGSEIGEDFYILSGRGRGTEVCVAFSSGISPKTMLLGWLRGVCVLQGNQMSSKAMLHLLDDWRCQGWDTVKTTALEEQGYRVSLLEKQS